MKKIVVELQGGLDKYLKQDKYLRYTVPDDTTINCLISRLNLERCYLGAILQNENLSQLDDLILEGAKIKIYPVFGGG